MLTISKPIQTPALTWDTTVEYYEKVDGDVRLRELVRQSLDRQLNPFEAGHRIAARANMMNHWRSHLSHLNEPWRTAAIGAALSWIEFYGVSEQEALDLILRNGR